MTSRQSRGNSPDPTDARSRQTPPAEMLATVASLESFLRAGQDALKQFEGALTQTWSTSGVAGAGNAGIFEFIALVADIQRRYLEQWWKLWGAMFPQVFAGGLALNDADKADKRFKDDDWRTLPYYDGIRQSYLAGSRQLYDFVDRAQVDPETKLKIRFYARQFIDAMSPANFPATNPEVIRKAIETKSASLAAGMNNLMQDLQKGRITRVDESAFEVGGNLAVTPGSVVFENELIQLIQYAPTTDRVEKTPLLIVPPCINKYYLLDLGVGNSFVEWAVAQGHHVFLISWRSAVPETAHLTWDQYLELGPLRAIDIVSDITGVQKIHTLGFCVGGTIMSCAAGVLAARQHDRLASLTLLTTMLDFTDTGDIGLLIDHNYVVAREASIGHGGILDGKELAFTFGTLRANDLIWRYVVDSYLKGASPDEFDLLYWDSDSVGLPGPMYCWYTRNTYLENNIKESGKTVQCGVPVDLSRVTAPIYMLASREDHIVPWKTAYRSRNLIGSEPRFVLAASGHVAGVINPPAKRKRHYWLNDAPTSEPEGWLEAARQEPGSWWPDWDAWMKDHSSGTVTAPAQAGNDTYRAIEPAPGRYVRYKSN